MLSKGSGQQGFSAIYVSFLIAFSTLAIGANVFLLASNSQRVIANNSISLQALYAAESGAEDALVRLKKGLSWANPLIVPVGNAQAQTTISDFVGGVRTVLAAGSLAGRARKVQAVYAINSANPSFFYGAHIGVGGLVMDNLSKVVGNVFSNGDVVAEANTEITNTVVVAGTGKTINGATIKGDAEADRCSNSAITGKLKSNTPGNCTFGSFALLGTPPSPLPLPISSEDIDKWRAEAEAGGLITGEYKLDGTSTASLGPKKIVGNLEVADKAVLTLTGTLWVTGNVNVKNEAQVRLHVSYSVLSGVIIADGITTIQNSSVSSGSGTQGSYLMYLSTNTGNPAMTVKNNSIADIIYSSAGWIEVENNNQLRQVTGHGVHLKNNATITYETGLQNAAFVSGPGGGWQVVSWKEVE